jgi:soluble lytic murein transglycosylase
MDAPLAKKTLDDLVAAEPQGPLLTHEQEVMKKPLFSRALRLLEVGEIDTAKKDFLAAGATTDSAESDLVWSVAEIYVRAGAPEAAVSLTRSRITDHLAHAPGGRWRKAWEVAYPRAFDDRVTKGATEAGIPVSVVWGVMREESGFYAEAKSPSGALGLMQLMPGTAKELAKTLNLPFDEDSLKRPEISIAFGAKLLASLRTTYALAKPLAIGAYNAGSGAVQRWLAQNPSDFDLFVERIPFDETRGYVKRVVASQGTYAFLYANSELAEVLSLPEHAKQ